MCTFASVLATPVSPIISVFTLVKAVSGSWNRPVSLYEVGVIDSSSKKNSDPSSVPSGRLLVYSLPVSSSSTSRMLSIITTNRKRIAIAPTYTMMYTSPRYATPSRIRYPATLRNTEIRNSTEITGLLDVITRIPDATAPNASTSSSTLFIDNVCIILLLLSSSRDMRYRVMTSQT